MLFNSYEFIFLFLPLALTIFHMLGRRGYQKIAILWLVSASLFFYGWYNPSYLSLILVSIIFNFTTGFALSYINNKKRYRYLLVIIGVMCNLLMLAYFKYANFFVENIADLTGTSYNLQEIILPLAISFFTFQQIAYLVDAYKGKIKECTFLHYCLFVTFFPQLIAGPIVHHKEILPQFAKNYIYRFNDKDFVIGVTIFILGLFKKVVIADGVEVYATPVFAAAEQGVAITFFEAWGGVLSYTFQIYFDFSGYSDMAIGIGRMFGIRLPLNFHSPYKAVNIITFWRSWHITLSRFLADYIYIPLGGSHKNKGSKYLNLMITMFLGGLWHGAGWTFIVWGVLHGFYLVINHAWRDVRKALGFSIDDCGWFGCQLSRLITFTAVAVSWVFFRAESIESGFNIVRGLMGVNGIALPLHYLEHLNHIGGMGSYFVKAGCQFKPLELFDGSKEVLCLGFLLFFIWYFPNTQQFMSRYKPALIIYDIDMKPKCKFFSYTFSVCWAIIFSVLAIYAIINVSVTSKFLYFNF